MNRAAVDEFKGKGWFARKVKVLIEDLDVALARMDVIEHKLRNLPGLEGLLEHPMVKNYENYDKRLRQMEQTWNLVSKEIEQLRRSIIETRAEITRAERRVTRGA